MFEMFKIIITLCSIALAVICIVYAKANKSYMISIIGLFIIAASFLILFTSRTDTFASTTSETETELSNYYPVLAVVTETNTKTDTFTLMTLPDENLWIESESEDWSAGDLATCVLYDNGTLDDFEDDEIVAIRYVGYVDGENSTSETGEKLEYFNLNSTVWDLEEN